MRLSFVRSGRCLLGIFGDDCNVGGISVCWLISVGALYIYIYGYLPNMGEFGHLICRRHIPRIWWCGIFEEGDEVP